MVVIIKIGRRVPRNWTSRFANRVKGLFTFQENIWLIIDRSLVMAKKKCAKTPNGGTFLKQTFRDVENIHYDLEWTEIKYIGNPTQEEEEYKEALQMFNPLNTVFKSSIEYKNNDIEKVFKTTRLNPVQLEKAYKQGFDSSHGTSIQQQLLKLGIITYIEKIDDNKISK
jgi:hypothetical protein